MIVNKEGIPTIPCCACDVAAPIGSAVRIELSNAKMYVVQYLCDHCAVEVARCIAPEEIKAAYGPRAEPKKPDVPIMVAWRGPEPALRLQP